MNHPSEDAAVTPAGREQRLRQIAHDIGTPLSIICLGIDNLKNAPLDGDFRDMLEMIESEGAQPLKQLLAKLNEIIEDGSKPSAENDGK